MRSLVNHLICLQSGCGSQAGREQDVLLRHRRARSIQDQIERLSSVLSGNVNRFLERSHFIAIVGMKPVISKGTSPWFSFLARQLHHSLQGLPTALDRMG